MNNRRPLVALLLIMLVTACSQQPAPPTNTAIPATALASSTQAATVSSSPTAQATQSTATATQPATAQATQPARATATDMPTPAFPLAPTTEAPLFARIALPPITTELPAGFKAVDAGGFGSFSLPAVQSSGSLPPITQAANLDGVIVPILMSPQQRELVGKQGFVVSPGSAFEFFEVYERNRYEYLPSFITSDSVLHAYHQAFDAVLRHSEMQSFSPLLISLDYAMAEQSAQYYEQLAGTDWEEAARRNTAYFAVPVALLDPEWKVPNQIADLVLPELEYIRAHDSQHQSLIFPDDVRGEDYTQYTPRGHYTRNEVLQRYFQAMMWHGRRSFTNVSGVANSSDPLIVRRQEVLMVQALREATTAKGSALDLWNAIYEPTSFFVGETDGLTPRDLIPPMEKVYGPVGDIRAVADDSKLDQVLQAVVDKRTEIIQDRAKGAGRFEIQFTPGLRFMGMRIVPDAVIFTKLVAPKVNGRLAPKALDVFAALGSDRALQHLKDAGDTQLSGYSTNMEELRTLYSTLPQDSWGKSVYLGWLNTLQPLLQPAPEGYPAFMRSDVWLDKQLNTALASWTELKHDTLLYAKQVSVEAGGFLPPPVPELPRGYVEPVPVLYARIAALSSMTKEGLESRGLLIKDDALILEQIVTLAQELQRLSEKQLRGEQISDEEAQWIINYGKQLENITSATEMDPGDYGGTFQEPVQAALVADIATTNQGVLHVGTGKIFHILVAVPTGVGFTIMRGGVFSFYEFLDAGRLSDADWRKRITQEDIPDRPIWTRNFEINETMASVFTERILGFNNAITMAFWIGNIDASPIDNPTASAASYLTGAELADTKAFIQQMNGRNEFIGMKRILIEFRSFDMQAKQATVTTRERWQESTYPGNIGDYFTDLPKALREREYSADVTYTLVLEGEKWMMSKIVIQEQP